MQPEDDQVYLEWLAAAPKGVRWDKAQEMWQEYQRKQREQAAEVANRLLGKKPNIWKDWSWYRGDKTNGN